MRHEKNKFIKYKLLITFVVISILLFIVGRIIIGTIYNNSSFDNPIAGALFGIDLVNSFFCIYLLILFVLAIIGLQRAKTLARTEYIKGFKLSIMFCTINTLFDISIVVLWDSNLRKKLIRGDKAYKI